MKIVYFGTSSFSALVLAYLIENGIEVAAVVTRVDKPKGRSALPTPPPVKAFVEQHDPSIAILQPTKLSDPTFVDMLRSYNADMFVCVAYGKIIPDAILALPRLESINLHTSLLPKYRGAAPIQRAIMEGETRSGVTIMKMVKELDAGDIISVVSTPIDNDMTFGELEEKLCTIGKKELLRSLIALAEGTAHTAKQDESKATYAEKVEVEDCKISWDGNARNLYNIIRGVTPHPGAWCTTLIREKERRLKICGARLSPIQTHTASPGTILAAGSDGITVACREGAVLLTALQPEGKKCMTAEAFLRGTPLTALKFVV